VTAAAATRSDSLFDMMEFDREEHGREMTDTNGENDVINTENHAPCTEEDHTSREDNEENQKSWSLERNWGFTLHELFRLALKFFKGKLGYR